LSVGRGDQALMGWESPFALSDGLVVTHEFPFRRALTGCRPGREKVEFDFRRLAVPGS
jgi:hypothetical protein